MKCIYPSAVSCAWVTGDIWLTRVWTCLVTVITVPSPGTFYIKKRSKLCVYWIKQVVDLFIIYWEFEQQISYIITHTHLHLFCDVMIFYIHKSSNLYIPVNSVQYISYEQKKKIIIWSCIKSFYYVSLTLRTIDSIKSQITSIRTIAVNMMALFIIKALSTRLWTILTERIASALYKSDFIS